MNFFAITVLSLFLASCVSSPEREVSLNDPVTSDEAYYPTLEKHTRSADVLVNFETRSKIRTTYLGPEFQKALGDRLNRIMRKDAGYLGEAMSGRISFFISVYSHERDLADLTNKNYWTVLLNAPSIAKPVAIKRINDKLRWKPFFDHISPWSQEYLVVFDTPSLSLEKDHLEKKAVLSLLLANADSQIVFEW